MDLSGWRKRIDGLDRKILTLLNERAECVLRLAPLKRQQAIPIEEPEREAAIRASLNRHNDGPLSHEAVWRIFEAIMGEMKAVQKEESRRAKRRPKPQASAGRAAAKRSSRADLK
ncbi:MAG: chorismate mutase [Bryobacterales bacterium]